MELPQEGQLQIAQCGETWLLHHGTGELALLPTDMEWREEIHFNDNHQAYVVNVAGQTRWVSAFLNHHLYKAGEKKLVCSWLPDRPEKLLVKEEINQANTKWLSHKRVLIDVANQRQRNLAVWPRMLPKEGMSCSIDLHSFHKDAGIQASKWPSTWLKGIWTSITKYLHQDLGLPPSHLRTGTQTAEEGCGCPCATASSHALLALLSRWASHSRKGMQLVADRETCREHLRTLICYVSHSVGKLRLRVWGRSCRWNPPALWVGDRFGETWEMTDGCFDASDIPSDIMQTITTENVVGNKVGAEFVLISMSSIKPSSSNLRSLIIQLGSILDMILWRASMAVAQDPTQSRHEMLRNLAKYVAAGRHAFAGSRRLSLSVDASRVGKRKILSGVIADSSGGVVAILPPQVAP